MDLANYDCLVKTIIIGDSGVGKSSLLYRYTDQDWNPHYIATIGVDFKVMTFERQNKVVKLQLWDTAGQERFRTITHAYYRGSHGIMIVYDVTNRESFENIKMWLDDVKKYGADQVPMVLVGNKADMIRHREVSKEEADAFAAQLGCEHYEASAKDDVGVDNAFDKVVDHCLKQRSRIVNNPGVRPAIPLGGAVPMQQSSRCQC
jgi:Ras-related protein Rab-1A